MIPLLAGSGGISKGIKWAAIIIAAIIAILVIRKQIKKYQERQKVKSTNNIDGKDGMANVLANRARAAMKGWGTNENTLLDIAKVIARGETTFNAVANAYYTLFERNFSEDLSSELDSKELKEFYSLVGKAVDGLNGFNQTVYLT